ncbi:cupin domain-containing protein [Microbacterium sp. HA-8]|uniref:cupin domain-containing protein n=1 Tax=Microbacterium sp. HA-8 TaxID=3234200 RepID=UPI0038F7769B
MRIIDYDDVPEEWVKRTDMEVGQWSRHLVGAAITATPALAIDFARFPPGFEHHLHRHPHADQLIVALDGVAIMTGPDGEARELRPGQVALLPRNEWHGARNESDTDVTCLVLFPGVGSVADAGYEESVL